MGLEITSYGTQLGMLRDGLGTVIEHASGLGVPYVVLFWAPCESREAVLAQAAEFNEIGARLKEHGLTFCYHNHDHEFKQFDGKTGLDILLGNTDPALVLAEIDAAWVRFGGADPTAVIRQYRGRCPLVHVKDIYTDAFRGAWTEVGTGIVDVKGVLEAGLESGVEWFIVEQDQPRDLLPMESIRVSYENLEALAT
jgi:sugar phosphate isomerase/epimerase